MLGGGLVRPPMHGGVVLIGGDRGVESDDDTVTAVVVELRGGGVGDGRYERVKVARSARLFDQSHPANSRQQVFITKQKLTKFVTGRLYCVLGVVLWDGRTSLHISRRRQGMVRIPPA